MNTTDKVNKIILQIKLGICSKKLSRKLDDTDMSISINKSRANTHMVHTCMGTKLALHITLKSVKSVEI